MAPRPAQAKTARTPYQEYEDFVAKLYSGLSYVAGLERIGHGQSNRHPGFSGARHQVDVSFIVNSMSPPTLFLVECKCRAGKRRNADKPTLHEVKTLRATIEDVQRLDGRPCQGVFFARKLPGAKTETAKYAAEYRIEFQCIDNYEAFGVRLGNHAAVGSTGIVGVLGSSESRAFQMCPGCGARYESTGSKLLCDSCVAAVV